MASHFLIGQTICCQRLLKHLPLCALPRCATRAKVKMMDSILDCTKVAETIPTQVKKVLNAGATVETGQRDTEKGREGVRLNRGQKEEEKEEEVEMEG